MKGCWRLTDNRHWNSPARMSDGRSFTNYKSSGLIAKEIQDRIGLDKGKQTYRDYLQKNGSTILEQMKMDTLASVFTSNSWANTYAPPPPANTIVASKRDGMEIKDTGFTNGIGFGVPNENIREFPIQTPYANCTGDEFEDPRWGISPDTLVLTKRYASGQGGRVWGWLDSEERA